MRKVIVTSFLTLDWVVQPDRADEGDIPSPVRVAWETVGVLLPLPDDSSSS